jgi:hypothetical protein
MPCFMLVMYEQSFHAMTRLGPGTKPKDADETQAVLLKDTNSHI